MNLPQPITRQDMYKDAIYNGIINNLPAPVTRQDYYLKALADGIVNDLPIPVSRLDMYMFASATKDISNLPTPITRSDLYWYAIATGDNTNVPIPINRSDMFDYYLTTQSSIIEWLEVTGTKIVIPNSRQGYSKELGIKGRTLQNLYNPSKDNQTNEYYSDGYFQGIYNNKNMIFFSYNNGMYKPNTTYTVIYEIIENTLNCPIILNESNPTGIFNPINTLTELNKTGIIVRTVTTRADITVQQGLRPYIGGHLNPTVGGKIKLRYYIIEGDYTNTDLPTYIDGIESTGSNEGNKVSIQSKGKNLADISESNINNIVSNGNPNDNILLPDGSVKTTTDRVRVVGKASIFNVKENTTYTFSTFIENEAYGGVLEYKDYPITMSNGKTLGIIGGSGKRTLTFTTSAGVKYISVEYAHTDSVYGFAIYKNIQLEEGTVATEYQPYQSPQLTEWQLTEPLRSLPNGVCDEVDKNGLETRRVGKVVLNSNNPNVRVDGFNSSFSQDINLINYFISDGKNKNGTSQDYVVDKTILVSTSDRNINNIDKICTFIDNANRGALIQYILPKSITTIEQAKTYIDSKNVTVLYELATPTTNQLTKQNIATFEGGTTIECTNNVQGTVLATVPVKQ